MELVHNESLRRVVQQIVVVGMELVIVVKPPRLVLQTVVEEVLQDEVREVEVLYVVIIIVSHEKLLHVQRIVNVMMPLTVIMEFAIFGYEKINSIVVIVILTMIRYVSLRDWNI
jgi:hypothetical protein